jgi:hypothetical protein
MRVLILLFVQLFETIALSQGTLLFDQQSSTNETPPGLGDGVSIQAASPYGQSFTPGSNAVDFIRLKIDDSFPSDGLGGMLHIDLKAGSIFGTTLASTTPVTLSNGFAGVVTFFFPAPISLAPGSSYVFEPIPDTGNFWNVAADEYNYPGGTAIYQGSPLTGSDLWFREGIIVPEPSSGMIALLGVSTVFYARRRGKCLKRS